MGDKHVKLFERSFVQQQVNSFPRRQLATGVLSVNTRLAATQSGLTAAIFELFQNIFHDGPL